MSSLCVKSLESLFISKVRVKALKFFMMNPDRPIHLRGAVREFNEEINAVRRELTRLEETKIVLSESKGNKKYFVTNKSHPFFDDLLSLIHKSYGLGGEILFNLKKIGEIEFAFLTPAFTKGQYNGNQIIDLVLIGNIDLMQIEEIIHRVQNEIGKEVHYMILKSSDFQIRKRRHDQLIVDFMLQDNVMLVGNYNEFVK